MSDSKENVDVLKMYGEDSTTQRDEFLKKHNLNEKGLTSKQAEINIKKFGLNETKKAKPKKWYNYLLQSLLTPFNCILIGISIILIYTDIYLAIEPSYANIIVIAILVTASTLLDFFASYHLPVYLHRGAACHLTFYIPYLDVFHVIVPASLPIPR